MAGSFRVFESFPSEFVTARRVDVWLPPGYDESDSDSFPVVYAHDGQNLFEASTSFAGVDWGLDEAIERLAAENTRFAAIVVGIWNSEARIPEYMPQKPLMLPHNERVRSRFAERYGGEPLSDHYLQFLVEELKPAIDREFRTRTSADSTVLLGSSMGGLVSLYGLCEYPEVFGGAGCISTHWPIGAGICVEYWAKYMPDPGSNRVYFDYGTATLDSTYQHYQERVDSLMLAVGYTPGKDWITRKFEGDDHSERSWSRRIHIPLRFFLKKDH